MIYLDHASATPVSEKAKDAMVPYFSEQFFNPGAPYLPAKHVREAYESLKSEIARAIGAKGANLIMTSGATESTNLAFTVVNDENEVLVLETEHASVLNTAKNYHYKTIKVQPKSGLIDLNDLKSKITEKTVLISVALVNNELGVIQPFSEIAEIIREKKLERLKAGNSTPLYLHSDASQALGLLNVNIARLKVDLLTLSSAKVYGPKGVGALYVSSDVRLHPLAFGGGQEQGLRSGTENVPGTAGFATAIAEAKAHIDSSRKKYLRLKTIFEKTLEKNLKKQKLIFLGAKKHQLASFCPISFPGLDAERLIYKLEESEIYVSTGAACAASKGEKSHVLKAIGLSDEEIAGSLRISFGALNDEENVILAAEKIAEVANAECQRIMEHKNEF